jgi:hypothetical protein
LPSIGGLYITQCVLAFDWLRGQEFRPPCATKPQRCDKIITGGFCVFSTIYINVEKLAQHGHKFSGARTLYKMSVADNTQNRNIASGLLKLDR